MAESIDNPKVLGIILGMAGMIVFLVLGFMVFTGYQPDVKIDDTAFDPILPTILLIGQHDTLGFALKIHLETGKVELAPGVALDEASLLFWAAVEQTFETGNQKLMEIIEECND